MSEPKTGKSTAQLVATLSILVGLGVLIVLAVASRRETDASGLAPKNTGTGTGTTESRASGQNENSSTNPEAGGNPVDPHDGRDPAEVKAARLREKMIKQSRMNWTRRTEEMARSQEIRHGELDRFVKAPADKLDAIRDVLRREEAQWLKETERYLEPVFRGDADPKANPYASPAYIALVEGITQASDAHVKLLLDETQWKQYSQWRPKFNAERYLSGW